MNTRPPARESVKQSASQLSKADRVMVRWELFGQPDIRLAIGPLFGFRNTNRLMDWAGATDSRLKRAVRILRNRALAYRQAGYRADCVEKAASDLIGCIGDFIQ